LVVVLDEIITKDEDALVATAMATATAMVTDVEEAIVKMVVDEEAVVSGGCVLVGGGGRVPTIFIA
jgi:hypothetical protein